MMDSYGQKCIQFIILNMFGLILFIIKQYGTSCDKVI